MLSAFRLLAVVSITWLMALTAMADIIAQKPCSMGSGRCGFFDATKTSIPVIRSFDFDMLSPGKALVRFDGTLQCEFEGHEDNSNVIDLATQIVTKADAVPNHADSGGGRYAMRFIFPTDHSFAPSTAVNLAGSRLIAYGNPGRATVFFKIVSLRMDAGTSCSVLSAAFSVVTFP